MAWFEKALSAKAMSTTILIRADLPKKVLFEAYEMAKAFEARYSAYREDSFLNLINSHAGIKSVPCQEDDIELFLSAQNASIMSEGAFDITIGALSHGAYHFGFANQEVAKATMITKQKELVDYRDFEIKHNEVFLKRKGMRLDIGGIGKGYIAKKIILFLKRNGATKALVDVGGEIVCFGKSYTIAIKDPFSEKNIGYVKSSIEPLSISTSGDYERFIGSKEHNHILNKKSGLSSNLYSSMSVIQNGFCIDMLDAYATALCNKTVEHVKMFAKKASFATITIDKESNVMLGNFQTLSLKGVEFYHN